MAQLRPVAVRLAGVGAPKIAIAGKPDCYGAVFASVGVSLLAMTLVHPI